MRLNYFLRGLGVGVVVTTLILTISHNANRKMSDNEIIERAGELGMTFVTPSEAASKEDETSAVESSEEETTSVIGTSKEETSQNSSKGNGTEDVLTTSSEKESETSTTAGETESQKETTTQKETESQKETTTQKETVSQEETSQESTTDKKGEVVTYTLTVARGMSSNEVCKVLYDNGIIDNAVDFDNYLVSRGYAEKIRVGIFEVRSDMSYDELAATFCSK